MATARERLLQTLSAVISQNFNEEAIVSLNRLLNSYRVQAKPENNIDKSITAREALAQNIVQDWKEKTTLKKHDIIRLIEPFRMQLKTGAGKRKTATDNTYEKNPGFSHNSSLTRREIIKENINKHENAYFRKKTALTPPEEERSIAGGPLPKAGDRGQCPKCHSLGVVLARNYQDDDSYSCIYCGYQAYISTTSSSRYDSSVSKELLGNHADKSDLENEE
ncbi:MAG: hypothetical protein KC505_03820 [Myxococcales bacterium]|nr:hypothetical protein [Myxococcales bacterium]USN51581.1 MAG: hypothetical protein H6731_04000 [Myxococcales bacterium]